MIEECREKTNRARIVCAVLDLILIYNNKLSRSETHKLYSVSTGHSHVITIPIPSTQCSLLLNRVVSFKHYMKRITSDDYIIP